MDADLLERAAAHGLTRDDELGMWLRNGSVLALVWAVAAPGDEWSWEPESAPFDAPPPPRFATEAEALTAALYWLDAGEPEVAHGR